MGDCYDKILCCDKGCNNDAAMWATLANRNNNDPMMAAAMMNGGMMGNGMWNNPFIYLVWMMFAQRMWGNDWQRHQDDPHYGYQALSNQIAAFQTRMQDNHNTDLLFGQVRDNNQDIRAGVDKITGGQALLQQTLCAIEASVKEVGGKVGYSAEKVINAVNMGDCNVIQALKDCCCSQKELIQRMGYENQLGMKDIQYTTQKGFCDNNFAMQAGFDRINTTAERGFSALGYQAAQDKCDIIRSAQDNTQRIVDTLNNHWKDEQAREIQDLKFQLSQERQNRLILSRCGRGNGCGNDCDGCGCNNGCGY